MVGREGRSQRTVWPSLPSGTLEQPLYLSRFHSLTRRAKLGSVPRLGQGHLAAPGHLASSALYRRDVAGWSAPAAAPSSGRRQRAAGVRFEPVGDVLRWIVPPGAYQPAFFRTTGEVS